jgi:hypothetical protein
LKNGLDQAERSRTKQQQRVFFKTTTTMHKETASSKERNVRGSTNVEWFVIQTKTTMAAIQWSDDAE